jgi:hypothetical protein
MDCTVPSELRTAVQRLRKITGFLTTLHSPNDRRPLFFSRYYHVRRVSWTAHWLMKQRINARHIVDKQRANWLVWAHDLNRWPFAHNSEKNEKRPFNQAADIPRYFSKHGITASPDLLAELSGILDEQAQRLSVEGRIVLLADMVSGFLEDPLMAIIGLDLRPEIVPQDIAEVLLLPIENPAFQDRLLRLNKRLHIERDGGAAVAQFDALFQECVTRFLIAYQLRENDDLGTNWFEELHKLVKDRFLRPQLFPYNNEKVGHGSLINEKLIIPLEDQFIEMLTEWDEPEFIEFAVEKGMITTEDLPCFLPDLDYISREEPEKSFRRSCDL